MEIHQETKTLPILDHIPLGYRAWAKQPALSPQFVIFSADGQTRRDIASAVLVRMDTDDAVFIRKVAGDPAIMLDSFEKAIVLPYTHRRSLHERHLCDARKVAELFHKYSDADAMVSSGKRRLFIDMDGTLCIWKSAEKFEDLFQPGWFANMMPCDALLKAVRAMIEWDVFDVYILSAVLSDSHYALSEKNAWLDRFLPQIGADRRLFIPTTAPKPEAVPGGVRESDILLDDYSKNLHEWAERGVAVKFMNGVNGTVGTWESRKGYSVNGLGAPETMIRDLREIARKTNFTDKGEKVS